VQPGNPIVGGTVLRIPAIQSPNYVAGVSGWIINKDGTVEFNNGVFRGTVTAGSFVGTDFIINSAGVFLYSGTPATGNLIISIASASGTDAFGNFFPAGINVSGGNLINIPAATAGSIAFTSEVFADSFARFVVAVGGTLNWGSGSVSADTNLYRSQTGQLQTDGKLGVTGVLKEGTWVVKETAGADEVWQTVLQGGLVLGTGWATDSATPGADLLKYRIDAFDNLVITGVCHSTSATPAATLFTVSGNWKPKALQRDDVMVFAGGVQSTNRVNISSSTGNVTLTTAITASNTDIYFDVCKPLGNLP
jgi:hypothetical protein